MKKLLRFPGNCDKISMYTLCGSEVSTVGLFRNLMPDFTFEHYDDVTPEFLTVHGIRALLIDIDNTLAPYEQPDADEAHRAYFAALEAAGIRAALISNNNRERVERFNRTLGLPAFWKCGKPRRKWLIRAMETLGSDAQSTAVLGDQLLTDAYAGKHIGLRALIVPPIKDKKTLFFRFKRLLERPVMRAYRRQCAAREKEKKEKKEREE